MSPNAPNGTDEARRAKSANLRTALVFASIAAVFFCGIIATKWMGGPTIGIGVMGVAVLVFLVFAIGRSIRK
jgi:asparagine N-glycosylation enzyme membrane subunit Stt3